MLCVAVGIVTVTAIFVLLCLLSEPFIDVEMLKVDFLLPPEIS